jgi:hypothetical protein
MVILPDRLGWVIRSLVEYVTASPNFDNNHGHASLASLEYVQAPPEFLSDPEVCSLDINHANCIPCNMSTGAGMKEIVRDFSPL